jgi:hypothetical protein
MAALANSKVQYVSSALWATVAAYPGSLTLTAAGVLTTNTLNSPALGSERVFIAITGGTTGASTPTWTTTKGASTTDGSVVWMECTGQPGVNGDTSDSPVWGASLTTTQGQIIYDATSSSLQMVLVAGTTGSGSAPTFSATAGTATSDNTTTWHSLGLASNFGAGAAPHKRVLNADAATWQTVTPALILIDANHNESQASAMTLAGGQGSASASNSYVSITMSGTMPPTSVTVGASIATTGANALNIQGYGSWYGVTTSCAGGGSNASGLTIAGATGVLYCESCTFTEASTASNTAITLGDSNIAANGAKLVNCAFTFSSTGQLLIINSGNTEILGGSVAATGTVPSIMAKYSTSSFSGNAIIRDCNLSQIIGTLVNFNLVAGPGSLTIENCSLGSGVSMVTGTPVNSSALFKMHNCDSGTKNYRFYETGYLATIQQETTVVDNTNKSTNGTTQWSVNLTTTANTSFGQPYVMDFAPFEWQNTTGSPVTIQIQLASGVTLNNKQIWMEVEYPGSSSTPLGSLTTSRASNVLATPVNYTTSSDSWGGSQTSFQYMSVTFTPQMVGPIKIRIYCAVSSTTIYINPMPIIVGVGVKRTYIVPGVGIVNEISAPLEEEGIFISHKLLWTLLWILSLFISNQSKISRISSYVIESLFTRFRRGSISSCRSNTRSLRDKKRTT